MLLLLIKPDVTGEAAFDISRPFRNDCKGFSLVGVVVNEFDLRFLKLGAANGL